jgi:antitoxin VapB
MTNITITKVFTNGNSQAVRLPKQFRLEDGEVCIAKDEDKIVIFPKPRKFDSLQDVQTFFDSIHCPDFELERDMSLPRPVNLLE